MGGQFAPELGGQLHRNLHIPDFIITNNLLKLKERIFHIHGSLDKNDIIVGIEDVKDIIPAETYMIRKSLHVDFNKFSFDETKNASVVKIFGHSLGISDEMYFIKLFNLWKQNRLKGRREILIYHKDSNEQIIYFNQRILMLTDYDTSGFKEINNYELIGVN